MAQNYEARLQRVRNVTAGRPVVIEMKPLGQLPVEPAAFTRTFRGALNGPVEVLRISSDYKRLCADYFSEYRRNRLISNASSEVE